MIELSAPVSATAFGLIAEPVAWVSHRVRPYWRPIAEAPQDGTRLMLWDSVSKRPVFGSWRGDNPAITHYAAEPNGPEVAR